METYIEYISEMRNQLGVWAIVLMKHNEENDTMSCFYHDTIPEDWAEIVNDMDSMNGRVYLSGDSLNVDNVGIDTLPGTRSKHPIESVYITKINVEGKAWGTLEILKDSDPSGFSNEEIRVIESRKIGLQDLLI